MTRRRLSVAFVVLVLLGAVPAMTQAQQAIPATQQAISTNPFGFLLEWFNAEYERKVSEFTTVGVGGSFFSTGDDDYVNGDLLYRFYPSGTPLEGWALGVKVGITKVSDAETSFGFGFDTNWNWLLGRNDNFYVAAGVGLKRLFGTNDGAMEFVPTIRIINVGLAF